MPLWEPAAVVQPPASLLRGSRAVVRLRLGPPVWEVMFRSHRAMTKAAFTPRPPPA
jgi:hypothetical protein